MAILFDLDGTLLDTAPDTCAALERTLRARQITHIPRLEAVRPWVSAGPTLLLQKLFDWSDEDIQDFLPSFKENYLAYIGHLTIAFPGVESLLAHLDDNDIPWGIVTNKHTRFAEPLLTLMGYHERAASVVYGDTLPQAKPHPEPLLLACEQMKVNPIDCIYVGDHERDIIAGQAAGMRTIAVTYGYISPESDLETWGADEQVHYPQAIKKFFA